MALAGHCCGVSPSFGAKLRSYRLRLHPLVVPWNLWQRSLRRAEKYWRMSSDAVIKGPSWQSPWSPTLDLEKIVENGPIVSQHGRLPRWKRSSRRRWWKGKLLGLQVQGPFPEPPIPPSDAARQAAGVERANAPPLPKVNQLRRHCLSRLRRGRQSPQGQHLCGR